VIRRWNGRADPLSAATLGRVTGAGLTVVGSVVRAGPDSVRLSASVIDARSQRSIGDFQFLESGDRIDRISDSLSAGVLRLLGRSRRGGFVGLAGLGTRSLPAAKAFLRGEQLYRRAAWDSAVVAYEQAFTLDTGFALAYSAAAHAEGWSGGEGSPRQSDWRLRAGQRTRGLSPRDSMHLLADSLRASIAGGGPPDVQETSRTRRQFALLERVTMRYPDDAEMWYDLGDAYYHSGHGPTSVPNERILMAFERAISLDSVFAPAYPHLVSLALREFRDTLRALRYIDRYLALSSPDGAQHQSLRLVAALLRQSSLDSATLHGMIRGVSPNVRQRALAELVPYPDRAETGARLARAVLSEPREPAAALGPYLRAAEALAWRGHLEEAYRALGPEDRSLLTAELFMLGVEPPDAGNVTQRWMTRALARGGPPSFFALLPWLTQRRDTISIGSVLALASRLSKGGGVPPEVPDDVRRNVIEYTR
jgi:tetratricopeptide (TPR) repeat protein